MSVIRYDVAHTFEIFARVPCFESDASLLSKNPSRLSTPPSRWDAARLRFHPRTLICSRFPPPLLCRIFAWLSELVVIASWIAFKVLSQTCGRPPACPRAPESLPLFPRPRPPPSISRSPSRSIRVGPRFRIPPRSAVLERPFEAFPPFILPTIVFIGWNNGTERVRTGI